MSHQLPQPLQQRYCNHWHYYATTTATAMSHQLPQPLLQRYCNHWHYYDTTTATTMSHQLPQPLLYIAKTSTKAYLKLSLFVSLANL